MEIHEPITNDPLASSEAKTITKDDLFHLLQNNRRRAVLRYFFAYPEQEEFNMRDIAEEIAAWENDIPVDQLRSNQRQRVYISLYQSHLPKLASYDVIEYNQARGTVKPTALTSLFEPYLASAFRTDAVEQCITFEDDESQLGLEAIRSLLER